jgi:hypothetical protein
VTGAASKCPGRDATKKQPAKKPKLAAPSDGRAPASRRPAVYPGQGRPQLGLGPLKLRVPGSAPPYGLVHGSEKLARGSHGGRGPVLMHVGLSRRGGASAAVAPWRWLLAAAREQPNPTRRCTSFAAGPTLSRAWGRPCHLGLGVRACAWVLSGGRKCPETPRSCRPSGAGIKILRDEAQNIPLRHRKPKRRFSSQLIFFIKSAAPVMLGPPDQTQKKKLLTAGKD